MFRCLQVPPGRPPGEQLRVVRVQRPVNVDQSLADDPLEDRALLRPLPDACRLALLGMDIHVGPRDVHIPAHHEQPVLSARARPSRRRAIPESGSWRRKSLPPFGTYDRHHREVRQPRRDDAVLEVERRMREAPADRETCSCGRAVRRPNSLCRRASSTSSPRARRSTPAAGRWRPSPPAGRARPGAPARGSRAPGPHARGFRSRSRWRSSSIVSRSRTTCR